MKNCISKLEKGLIVSCQAVSKDGHLNENDPFFGPVMMAAMARAAASGGAKGIRANGPEDVKAIREAVSLPIIGLNKKDQYEVRITPTFESAAVLVESGADIVALDCTFRKRPGKVGTEELISRIKKELGVYVMADVSTVEEGIAAEKAGANIVASTLSGYTPYTKRTTGPDIDLVKQLIKACNVPVICEGRIRNPKEAKEILEMGAYAVVVGAMITSPQRITESFVNAINAQGRFY